MYYDFNFCKTDFDISAAEQFVVPLMVKDFLANLGIAITDQNISYLVSCIDAIEKNSILVKNEL